MVLSRSQSSRPRVALTRHYRRIGRSRCRCALFASEGCKDTAAHERAAGACVRLPVFTAEGERRAVAVPPPQLPEDVPVLCRYACRSGIRFWIRRGAHAGARCDPAVE